jgi:hypothetical protein
MNRDRANKSALTALLNGYSSVRDSKVMDERQTLSLLAWTLGSVVLATFILNAVALSISG